MAEGSRYPALGALQGRMGEGFRSVQRPPQPRMAPRTNAPAGFGTTTNAAPAAQPAFQPPMRAPMPPMAQPPVSMMGTNAPSPVPAMSNYGDGMNNAGAAGMMFNMLPMGAEAAFGAAPPGGFNPRLRKPGAY